MAVKSTQERSALSVSVWVLLLGACSGEGSGSGALFTEARLAARIDFRLTTGACERRTLVETMLGGVGWIDYDGDGDWDLFAPNGHGRVLEADKPGVEADALWRNEGDGTFTEVGREAGVGGQRYSLGCAVGDYDNDGDSDLLVTNFGRNTLYRNSGAGRFEDLTEAAGLIETGFNTSAAWVDIDNDGDLDLYVARYLVYHPGTSRACREGEQYVTCHPRVFAGERHLLYRNRGPQALGSFEEIGRAAGIAKSGLYESKGLGVIAFDCDEDGWQDIFVANDTTPNFLWRNRGAKGPGVFDDVGLEAGAALGAEGRPLAGMGIDAGDVQPDGRLDLYVTNFARETNSLFLGQAGGRFVESNRAWGLGATYIALGFGTLFVDADLDGRADLVTLNGHVDSGIDRVEVGTGVTYMQRAAFFRNRGGSFVEAGALAGPWFGEVHAGRGLASCDYDQDGDVDLAAMTLDGSLYLLRSENPSRHRSVTLRLRGKATNRDGYGARLEVDRGDGRREALLYHSARSYLSACDPRAVIGLGTAARLRQVTIRWPSGRTQTLTDLPAGPKTILVEEPDS